MKKLILTFMLGLPNIILAAAATTQEEKDSALFKAAKVGNVTECIRLLGVGANEGSTNEIGRTPLHIAAANGHTEVCALLLDAGANIEAQMNGGATPLYMAAATNKRDVVELLLDRGANKNVSVSGFDLTALRVALKNEDPKAAAVLRNRGATLSAYPDLLATIPVLENLACEERPVVLGRE